MKISNYLKSLAIGIGLTGAIAFGSNNTRESDLIKKLRGETVNVKAEAQKDKQTNTQSKVDYHDLTYLDSYDSIINETIQYFNEKHKIKIDPMQIKAQIKREAGSVKERENSFLYDPMQISTAKKNCALEILANEKENTNLIGDFDILKGKTKPTWDNENNRWDYSKTNLDAKSSIYGGVGWLLQKAAIYDERIVESGDISELEIKQGDSFCKLARENESTKETFLKYNPNLNPTCLKIGQKIKFKKAKKETYIKGWRNFDVALKGYNGGGTPGYVQGVKNNLEELSNDKKVIVIDPGHGMENKGSLYDPGAVSGNYKEAEIVLGQAKKISQILTEKGYHVILTRNDAKTKTPLNSRIKIAKDNNADLFISLHCNANANSSAHGQEVYFGKNAKSKTLADSIQNSLINEISNTNKTYSKDRGVKSGNFRVLKSSEIPSVLVESGFITNEKDRTYLLDNIYDVETGIVNGIENYLNGGKK